MSGNNYNSLTETFTRDPLFNALLSVKGAPPADISFVPPDFVGNDEYLYSSGGAGNPPARREKFAINDRPRIRGIGLFSNLADGLVYQDNPDTFNIGPSVGLQLESWTAANVFSANIDQIQTFRVTELNQLFEVDYLFDVSSVVTTLDSLRLRAFFNGTSMTFATLSMDPAWADKRLIIRPVVVIEHTFELTAVS